MNRNIVVDTEGLGSSPMMEAMQMNDADVFDEYVKLRKRGRRLQRAPQPSGVIDMMDKYIGRARGGVTSACANLPKLPPIYADFVTNPAFNAFAFKHKNRYFIGIHDGLPIILAVVIYRMLADSRLFPDVGDPTVESSSHPLFSKLVPNAALLSANDCRATIPKDPQRQIYAIHLCFLLFDFLTAHEITHIAHGHVDYKGAERGIPYVSEADWMPDTPEGNLELQAMELDADSTAALMLVKTMKDLVSRHAQLEPLIAGFYRDSATATFNLAVAVSIMFRLFGDSRMNGIDLSAKSHPPRRWRQMQIMNMLGNYVDQFWDSTLVGPVVSAFTKAIADVEEAFELITGSPQQVQGLHDAWHGDGWPYATKVAECWNSIVRVKVAKYAYIEPNSYHFDVPTS